MHVSATDIIQWSDKREAQGLLPVLLRHLINATSQVKELSMPGGDAVHLRGWDGVVCADQANRWVPGGRSYWELGTSRNPAAKAKKDFNKRCEGISSEEAGNATFVFVTSRRWPAKNKWREEAKGRNIWADILVWDADDLEAWLETTTAISLWLGEKLGIAGRGVATVESYWENWSIQSDPAITPQALFTGRDGSVVALKNAFKENRPLIAVTADSQQEAVAFTCALLVQEGYSRRAACLTLEEGWQFLDANSDIQIVVIADNQLSHYRAPRNGMSLIVSMALGEAGSQYTDSRQDMVELKRSTPEEFEKSLLGLGVGASKTLRYSKALGRSWTVFRRRHARNPALGRPVWLSNRSNIDTLSVLTLIGAWDEESDGDKACVSEVANKSYEAIESDLRSIVTIDDSPVVKIGSVWKAKAPLDLLYLIVERVPSAMLERFFQVAIDVLEKSDPTLELEKDKRWMASFYGKSREESNTLLEAMVDSVAKLGYFSDSSDHPHLSTHVPNFVRKVLGDASEERWLSLAPFLQSFAEASPSTFLDSLESSLKKTNKPVHRLLNEGQLLRSFDRCWHANLLWGLELIAANSIYMSRVAKVLTELSIVALPDNLGNTPLNSLTSLLRLWPLQTTASVKLRIRIIEEVVATHPDTGWAILMKLLPGKRDIVSPNAKPRWRDYKDLIGKKLSDQEVDQFVGSIVELLIGIAEGNAFRIAEVVHRINDWDDDFRARVILLVGSAKSFKDEEREVVRSAVRGFLDWENSFNRHGERHDRSAADALRPLFDDLAPDDVVLRHAWIFSSRWVKLPDGGDKKDCEVSEKARRKWRVLALREIHKKLEWQGLTRLAQCSGDCRLLGFEIAQCFSGLSDFTHWLCQQHLDSQKLDFLEPLTTGLLHAIPKIELIGFLTKCLAIFNHKSVASDKVAKFLSHAPQCIDTWRFLEKQPQAIQEHFWMFVELFYVPLSREENVYFLEKLLAVKRPRTALSALRDLRGLPSGVMIKLLGGIAEGQEEDVSFPDSFDIYQVFEALNEIKNINRSEVARLEYDYYNILRNSGYAYPNLIEELSSSPEFFVSLVCLFCKPDDADRELEVESSSAEAEKAFSIIWGRRGVPGRASNGQINRELFWSWINRVRELAKENHREGITDQMIGVWLSDWPLNKNLEQWPSPVIADLLDRDDLEEIRIGFSMGVSNSRGISSRSIYAGGAQEREIADGFRRFSALWKDSKPNLYTLIEGLVKSFECNAQYEDTVALLKQE